MKVSLQVLQLLIPGLTARKAARSAGKYKTARLFIEAEKRREEDVIYIADAQALHVVSPQELTGLTILLAEDARVFDRWSTEYDRCTWLVLQDHPDVAGALARIDSVFMMLTKWEADLNIAVYREDNVSRLVHLLERVISDPSVVWDATFRFLATANFDRASEIPVLQIAKSEGGWSNDIIGKLLKRTTVFQDSLKRQGLSLMSPPTLSGKYCAIRSFVLKGKLVMTFETFFLTDDHLEGKQELLEFLTDKIQENLNVHASAYTGRRKIYEQFLIDLLDGTLTTEQEIKDKLSYIKYDYTGNFQVFLIEFEDGVVNMSAEYIKGVCQQLFPAAKLVEFDNRIAGFNFKCAVGKKTASVCEKLRRLSENGVCAIGFSLPFYTLNKSRQALQQAMCAIRYGILLQKKDMVFQYRTYYVYEMIDETKRGSSRAFDSDASRIYQLREQDQIRKNDNEKLLKVYLQNGMKTSETAKQMNMHRNTVIYRINQLKEQLQMDFDNPEDVFKLMLGLKTVELEDAQIGQMRKPSGKGENT